LSSKNNISQYACLLATPVGEIAKRAKERLAVGKKIPSLRQHPNIHPTLRLVERLVEHELTGLYLSYITWNISKPMY
jgi:hypothetical protein